MLSEKARLALIDIQYNIAAARAFIGDMSFEAFKSNLMAFYAVVRALEIISEASRRLPEDLKDRHPGIPWRAMRDAGNFYRHEYDGVAASYIWKTTRERFGPLAVVVASELAADDDNKTSQTEGF
ncbi:MAG: DUF86 domain-containing protein [Beijerinckiaceae bacterium]|nr:DUF86 domain-containing protein [Beijerinckiaceae bacterium]